MIDENDIVSVVWAMLRGYIAPEIASKYFKLYPPSRLIDWARGEVGFPHRTTRSVLSMLEDPKVQEAYIDPQAVINALRAIELEFEMRYL
jgi:hypothetical protein